MTKQQTSEQQPGPRFPDAGDLARAAVAEEMIDFAVEVRTAQGPEQWRFQFRRPRSTADFGRMYSRGETLIKAAKTGWEVDGSKVHPEEATLRNIALLEMTLVQPKLESADLIALSERNGALFLALVSRAAEIAMADGLREVEAAKND